MKRYIIYIAVMLCAGLHTVEAQRTKTLYIYHTNDMHSRIDPYPTTFGDTLFAGKGGLVRRASFFGNRKSKAQGFITVRQWRLLARYTLLQPLQGRSGNPRDERDELRCLYHRQS